MDLKPPSIVIKRIKNPIGFFHSFIIKTRNSADQQRLKPGEQVEIGWLPEDCRALDAV